MIKHKIIIQIFKIIVAITITYCVCWLISTLSQYITYNYLMKKYLRTWSIYEGFADNLFFYFSVIISFYVLNLKNRKNTFILIVYFFVLYLAIDFGLDLYENYQSYLRYPIINGPYSYEIFKTQFSYRFDIFHSKYHFLTFLVHDFCRLLTIAVIAIFSKWIKNRIGKDAHA